MNLDWVIPCRYVEVHDNLGTIIGAGIDTYWVRAFPTTIQVVLAVRVLAMAEELRADVAHRALNRIRDPRGEIVSEVGGEFSTGDVDNANQDWLNGSIVASLAQIEVTEEGTYTIEYQMDESSKELPIHIVLGPPPGTEWPDEESNEGED